MRSFSLYRVSAWFFLCGAFGMSGAPVASAQVPANSQLDTRSTSGTDDDSTDTSGATVTTDTQPGGEVITASSLDSTGTENNGGAAALASNTATKAFTIAANSDLLVVEVDIRDASSSNPGMPSTITFTSSANVVTTLNQAVSQNSVISSWHNVAIYYANITPVSTSTSGTISGVFGTSGNLYAYAISAFSVGGENTTVVPNTNSADVGGNTQNPLTLTGVQAGDIAFVIAASGPGKNGVGMNVTTSSSGSVTTTTATTGGNSSQGYPNNNYIMGYISGLASGSNTFTATQTGGNTGGKFVFAAADFDSTAVQYSTRSADQINSLLQPTRTDTCSYAGGVPLGGIGTGTVDWRGDGSFREWQIFNNWGNGYETVTRTECSFLNAFAAVNINGTAHVLETSPVASLPGVSAVTYTGTFPFANLAYTIPGSPVTVSAEGFGIYVPHDTQDSATPAIGLTWTFTNTTSQPAIVSLALSLVNPLGVDCTQSTANGLTTTVCTRGAEGMGVEALDATPVSIVGGNDTDQTATSFWSAFSQSTATAPTPVEQGQRFGQMVTFTVPANATIKERFVVGWNFPNHYEGGTGTFVGHQYSNWITDAQDAVNALAGNFNTLRTNSLTWAQTLQNSSWPSWLNYWLVNNQNTITKFSWWTGTNHFMDYESSDLPNGSPIHITDLANWPVLDAFPSLDLELLTHFGDEQQSNGRIPEQFNSSNGPGITSPNFERDLIDINPKWVMQVYHRWRETGNAAFLAANYAKAKASILYQAPTSLGGLQDNDALSEGIPNGTNYLSTWDHWNNAYTFAYGGSVYLGGVLAMEQMAQAENDTATVTAMQNIYAQGLTSMNNLLWNGEFYSMTTILNNGSQGAGNNISHSESTYGDDFARFIGLGAVLPDANALSTLRAVAKYNGQATPYGVVNTATTDMADSNISTDSGGQLSPGVAPGTQVEYENDNRDQITCCHDMPPLIALLQQGNTSDQAAALSLLYNMYTLSNLNFSGQAVQSGDLWNLPHHVVAATGAEVPTGDFRHYLRDRALYSIIKVLNGWVYNGVTQAVTIGPIMNPQLCSGPWSCPVAFGTLAQTVANSVQTDTMTNKDVNGTLTLKQLNVLSQVGTVGTCAVTLNGAAVSSSFTQSGSQVQIAFPSAVSVPTSGELAVNLASSTAVAVSSASSQLVHGMAGTFSLPLNLTGTVSIEPRQGSPRGSYNVVVTFNTPVTALTATLGLQSGSTGTLMGTAQAPTLTAATTTVSIPLTGVGNAQRLNLHLSAIQPGFASADIPLNVDWGDVNADSAINILDLGQIRLHTAQPVSAQNFQYDVNADGSINILDLGQTRLYTGTALH